MRTDILPKNVLKALEPMKISEKDILGVCPIDLSTDSTYTDGYFFVCEKYVGVATWPFEEDRVRYFRSVKVPENLYRETLLEPDVRLYEIKDITGIHIERQVASNIVTIDYGDRQVMVTALTNLYMEQMSIVVRICKDIIKAAHEDSSENNPPAGFAPDSNPTENGPDGKFPGKGPDGKFPGKGPDGKFPGKGPDGKLPGNPPPGKGHMHPEEDRPAKKAIFIRVLKYLFKYKWSVICLFILYFAAAGISLIWPYLSGTLMYDHVLKKDNEFLARFGLDNEYTLALVVLVIMMIGTKLIQQGVSMIQSTLVARLSARTVRDMKVDIFSSMGDLSLSFFTSKQTGGLMTRVRSDADRITDFFIDGFPFIFVHSFTIISTFIVMFQLNWQLSLVAVVLLPVLVILSVKLRPGLWSLFGRRHRAERTVTSRVNDNLTGARVVKAFGRENHENDNFSKPNKALMDAEINIVKYNNRFTILYNLVQEISNIWVWILGVILLLEFKSIEMGVLITFVGYVGQLSGPMNFFAGIFRMWTDSINAAQRMFEIIDAIPEIREANNPVRLDNPRGEIELDHVTFGYEFSRPVLKDISLKVHSGELLGIVGRSGAGKSTLVNLISRLYDVDEGAIRIDGHDVRDIAFKDLRRNVAMVSQDTYIFMGSVADNIAYADRTASRADIIRAAKLASAHEFISRMPDGYDTIIGASGKDLSGGEKQRISIARAILANPKILILDEATASVDTETERAIQKSINYLVNGRTTLSIAHRLSTLRDASRLIVLDHGRIVEEGTRTELYALNGVYTKLEDLQTKALSLKQID